MANVSLQLLAIKNEATNNRLIGDIIAIHKTSDLADWNAQAGEFQLREPITGKTAFVHVFGVPIQKAIEFGEKLSQPIFVEQEVNGVVLPVPVRDKRYFINPAQIPPAARQKLLLDREITAEYLAVLPFINRKQVNVVNDPDQDTFEPLDIEP